VLFYHSVSDKQIVGLARVDKEHYSDPTAQEGDWSAVDLKPVKTLRRPVGLDAMKKDGILKDMALIKQSRLSVTPLTSQQFERLMQLGETKP